MKEKWYEIADEVEKALENQQPVVALESTLIAQGLPYPKNIEVALAMEGAVRQSGAVPATIGIINGICKIGLSRQEVEFLGDGKSKVFKVGEGELPFVIGTQKNASTTVSGTAWLADRFNIKVFATGGTGGVHRNVTESYDVSQDLFTMSHTPIVIVSSGAKSILDIQKTNEVMESYGILIVGYRTDYFPAFYSRKSSIGLNYRVDEAVQVAKVYRAKSMMKSKQALLVANPVPEADEIDEKQINKIIQEATEEASRKGIKGKEITPFLLANIAERSGGTSMKANIALLINNAKTAGEIAVEVSKVLNNGNKKQIGFSQE
ncbi:MAG TPA: pseudouridine-5'-phosphate glycosidase [Thermotogota bacterium]|nr:pseudouridine-5'-phosphate glycosidase [Thermotogota bacterium]HRW33809.1 pseudouridine-5'-phosphate glycosidase [Thermotogota bacterium]